jgi:hypothetical protein
MHQKIVFLDIDGVLNTGGYVGPEEKVFETKWMNHQLRALNPTLVPMLNRIEADFVLSSSWRYSFKDDLGPMLRLLRQRGFTGNLIGRTPLGSERKLKYKPANPRFDHPRGHEIMEWMSFNPTLKFAILDDEADMDKLVPFLVRTSFKVGLTPEHVDRVIALLK